MLGNTPTSFPEERPAKVRVRVYMPKERNDWLPAAGAAGATVHCNSADGPGGADEAPTFDNAMAASRLPDVHTDVLTKHFSFVSEDESARYYAHFFEGETPVERSNYVEEHLDTPERLLQVNDFWAKFNPTLSPPFVLKRPCRAPSPINPREDDNWLLYSEMRFETISDLLKFVSHSLRADPISVECVEATYIEVFRETVRLVGGAQLRMDRCRFSLSGDSETLPADYSLFELRGTSEQIRPAASVLPDNHVSVRSKILELLYRRNKLSQLGFVSSIFQKMDTVTTGLRDIHLNDYFEPVDPEAYDKAEVSRTVLAYFKGVEEYQESEEVIKAHRTLMAECRGLDALQ